MAGRAALRKKLAEAIRAFAGLDPPPWLLEARLAERAAALGVGEADYLDATTGGAQTAAAELEVLANLLRVGETRFFRHRAHIAALRTRVLPERAARARAEGRPLSAWSAGCASGEEAWTLAMLLDEAAPGSFRLLGTDLSEPALEVARAARYPEERLADVPAELRARSFEPPELRTVAARLKGSVRLQAHNLFGARYPGAFDVILCRNVLIYFDPERRNQVIARLADALHPGGYLFVGYSESLRDHEALFEAVSASAGALDRRAGIGDPAAFGETGAIEEQVVYRRRESLPPAVSKSARVAPIAPVSWADPAGKAWVHPAAPRPAADAPRAIPWRGHSPAGARADSPLPSVNPARTLALHGDYHDARRLADELRAFIGAPGAVVDLDGAAFLGDAAARVLARAVEAGATLELRATRPAIRRWLERHGLLP